MEKAEQQHEAYFDQQTGLFAGRNIQHTYQDGKVLKLIEACAKVSHIKISFFVLLLQNKRQHKLLKSVSTINLNLRWLKTSIITKIKYLLNRKKKLW